MYVCTFSVAYWHVTTRPIWLRTCPCLATYVGHSLFAFLTFVSIRECFLALFLYYSATIYDEIVCAWVPAQLAESQLVESQHPIPNPYP